MRYPKLLYMLMLYCMLLVLAGVVGWHWFQQSALQQKVQEFGGHLASHLTAEPAVTADLLSLAGVGAPAQIYAMQVLDASGKVLAATGGQISFASLPAEGWTEPPNFRLWRRPLADGRSLLLVVSPYTWSFWLVLWGLPLLMVPLLLTARVLWQRQRQLMDTLAELLPEKPLQTATPAELVRQTSLFIQALQQQLQHSNTLQQQAETLQVTARQQILHEQQQHLSQLQQLQSVLAQQRNWNEQWHLLAATATETPEAELRHWLKVLARLQQVQTAAQTVAVHEFIAALIDQMQPMWPADMLLLPDEDPQSLSYLAQFDSPLWQLLLQSLLLCIKPLLEGHEVLVGYRLLVRQPSELHYTVQFNGKSLPEMFRRQLLGTADEMLTWPDIRWSWCRQLLALTGGRCQITELADLGCRLEFSCSLSWQKVTHSRRWQNLVVCDQRPCRQALWQHSLLGVSEQVVLVAEIAQLAQATGSRLIDAVAVHLVDGAIEARDIALLQQVAGRFPLVLFTPEPMRSQLPADLVRCWQPSPLRLAALQKLAYQPEPAMQEQQLLVVDDNPTNLSFIRAMLAGQGVGIDIATTGTEALQLASRSRYQLILMDIQLPDISGIEVTRQLRQLRHHQQTSILAFTAHALPEEVASFRLAGMDDVMIKPLDARKIAHILSRLRPVTEMLSPG